MLDHFDAVKIGLTATPALHTVDIFGPPIATYSYRNAVVDGYLIDHEPPIAIKTELGEDGIHWKAGEEMVEVDAATGEVVDKSILPDEVTLEIESFNRRVVTESFNRVVCERLAQHIAPTCPKTIVFCVNDQHADMVVKLLKEAFDQVYGPIDDDLVQKITRKSDKPLQRIRTFKNVRHAKATAGQLNLTVEICRDVPIVLPPADQQVEIEKRVRNALMRVAQLGQAAALSGRSVPTLESSLLAAAFRGELVPQDPNDEPASVMLERLAAERAASEAKPAKSAAAKRTKRKR